MVAKAAHARTPVRGSLWAITAAAILALASTANAIDWSFEGNRAVQSTAHAVAPTPEAIVSTIPAMPLGGAELQSIATGTAANDNEAAATTPRVMFAIRRTRRYELNQSKWVGRRHHHRRTRISGDSPPPTMLAKS
jgi:hypothetical protein